MTNDQPNVQHGPLLSRRLALRRCRPRPLAAASSIGGLLLPVCTLLLWPFFRLFRWR
jgi:hypothetical protein